MEKTEKFKFLDHTADILIAAYGQTLEEAFENSALAMFEVMTDTTKVNPTQQDTVEVEAEDEYELLYNWLEALLVKFEVNTMLYSKFKIDSLKDSNDGYKLKATIWGEKYSPEKHPQKVAVKAVTYHRMEIIKEHDKVTLEFILDI
ncbi:MAG: archease [Chloroflexota bacterium]|jgi:SHS2 domain-containing protein|nr:archease [Candidatus Sulfotelmatobacter sp.]